MPFSPKAPREFIFWSIMLLFRSSVILCVFQLNGLVDILYAYLANTVVIVIRSVDLKEDDNLTWLAAPIVTAMIGLLLFNYLVAQEQRSLFLLERVSKTQQEESLEIINLLPGSVFILDNNFTKVLFKNKEFAQIDWITETGTLIDESFKFKIVPQI
jgi:hypothetical protein